MLLVSNYDPDAQESMLRFATALCAGLRASGVDAEIARPNPVLGRLWPGATGLGKWLGYVDKFIIFPLRLRVLARKVDIVHICDHSYSMYLRQLASRPHLITCHDMLAIRCARGEFPRPRTGLTGRILQRWILSGLRRARRLTCVSEATRSDVLRLTGHSPQAVSVTSMGQNFPYAPVAEISRAAESRRNGEPFSELDIEKLGLPAAPYLLHVGGTQWYKNRKGVLAIYSALRQRLGENAPALILVGPALPPSSSNPLFRKEGFAQGTERTQRTQRTKSLLFPGVETRERIDNATLAALYSGAELLLFPSLEEGFGWPIIEAQACGCRVLVTGKPPMTEVGGGAAFYLEDPSDAEAGAARVAELLAQDEPARRRAVRAGIVNAARFSTERMVNEYAALYLEALKS